MIGLPTNHSAKRDQGGRSITDGRAVGDVAANRRRVANLFGGIAAQKLGEGGQAFLHRGTQCGDGDAGPDVKLAALNLDALQVIDPVEEGHGCQVTQLFSHPKPDISRPGDQGGVRVREIPGCQFVAVARAEHAGGAAPGPRGYLGRKKVTVRLHPVWNPSAFRSLGRPDDRRIAGAAAQVAGKLIVMVGRAIEVRHGHADDKAWRAKAALAAMMGDHRLLHRVKCAARAGDALDRSHRLAVKLRQEEDACVQRLRAILIRDHHGAGAAVALIAAFLGAGQPARFAQPVKQCPCRDLPFDANRRSVQQKRNCHPSVRRGLPGQGSLRGRPMRRKAGHAPI